MWRGVAGMLHLVCNLVMASKDAGGGGGGGGWISHAGSVSSHENHAQSFRGMNTDPEILPQAN